MEIKRQASGPAAPPQPSFEIGDLVLYRPSFGTGQARLCRVIGWGIEDGQVVYDNDLQRWGYAHQYAPAPQEQRAVACEGCAA